MKFAPDGMSYAAIPLLFAVPAFFLTPGLGFLLVVLAAAVLAFYRDPERTPPLSGVVAPADGKVSVIREEGGRVRVGVFMNVTDVHVNRAPLPGTVEEMGHEPGTNVPAFSKDSDNNEKLRLDCGDHEVVLIAGWFARRIHPYVTVGDELERGQRIGHISFGSRADVILPEGYTRADLAVERGEKVVAGETVIAREPMEE